jgi:hypothetical protein
MQTNTLSEYISSSPHLFKCRAGSTALKHAGHIHPVSCERFGDERLDIEETYVCCDGIKAL